MSGHLSLVVNFIESGSGNEAYISTKQAYTKETSRVPSAHAHTCRSSCHQVQESEGPQAPGRLKMWLLKQHTFRSISG